MPSLSTLKRRALPSAETGLLVTARTVFIEMAALLARERKWRRDRAELAKMDCAALRDIGFISSPWSTDLGASDRFVRNIAWSSDKELRALLDDSSRYRKAAQGKIRQERADRSGNSDGPVRARR